MIENGRMRLEAMDETERDRHWQPFRRGAHAFNPPTWACQNAAVDARGLRREEVR